MSKLRVKLRFFLKFYSFTKKKVFYEILFFTKNVWSSPCEVVSKCWKGITQMNNINFIIAMLVYYLARFFLVLSLMENGLYQNLVNFGQCKILFLKWMRWKTNWSYLCQGLRNVERIKDRYTLFAIFNGTFS